MLMERWKLTQPARVKALAMGTLPRSVEVLLAMRVQRAVHRLRHQVKQLAIVADGTEFDAAGRRSTAASSRQTGESTPAHGLSWRTGWR
jgi:hypothetical protein